MTPKKPKRGWRTASSFRDVRARCTVCHADTPGWPWMRKNAQGVAARHTDATGHKTYVEVSMGLYYELVGGDAGSVHVEERKHA